MAIASVVLQLHPDRVDEALVALTDVPGLTLGDRDGAFVAGVVESPDAQRGAELCGALRDVPGVAFVDVVMVDLRDEEDT